MAFKLGALTVQPLGEYHDLCRREEANAGLSLCYYPPKTSLFWNALGRLGGFFVPQSLRGLLTGATTALDPIFEQAARKVGAFIYPASFAGMNDSEFDQKMLSVMDNTSSSVLYHFHLWADKKLGFRNILQVPDQHLEPSAFCEGAAFLLGQSSTIFDVTYVEFFQYNVSLPDNVEQHWFAALKADFAVDIACRTMLFVGAPERPLARIEELDFTTHGTIPSVEKFLSLIAEKRDEQSWPDFLTHITDPAFPLISILEEERPTMSLQLLPPIAQEKLVHHLRNLNKS